MTAAAHVEAPTRERREGVIDKIALMRAMAERWADDPAFQLGVMRAVAKAGNGADAQARAWARHVEKLPYRREMGELYRRSPEVVGFDPKTGRSQIPTGGDCDDHVIALVAGLLHLGIPVQIEVASDEDGWGFHVRTLVGLPPTKPKIWVPVDTVWRSEREWAMAGKELGKSPLVMEAQLKGRSLRSAHRRNPQKGGAGLTAALTLGLLWFLSRKS